MKERNNIAYEVSYEETTFWGLFRIVGVKIKDNWSLLWAVIITVSIVCLVTQFGSMNTFLDISKDLSGTFLSASAGILGIVIAALTVTITLFHQNLLPQMLQSKLLHRYLFPFWGIATLWGANMVITVFLIILQRLSGVSTVIKSFFIFELFLFLYATFYTIKLTGIIVQLSLQKAQIKEK